MAKKKGDNIAKPSTRKKPVWSDCEKIVFLLAMVENLAEGMTKKKRNTYMPSPYGRSQDSCRKHLQRMFDEHDEDLDDQDEQKELQSDTFTVTKKPRRSAKKANLPIKVEEKAMSELQDELEDAEPGNLADVIRNFHDKKEDEDGPGTNLQPVPAV